MLATQRERHQEKRYQEDDRFAACIKQNKSRKEARKQGMKEGRKQGRMKEGEGKSMTPF